MPSRLRRAPRRGKIRNDERINVGLPREMHARLLAEAEAANVPLSIIVRMALAFYQDHAPAALPFRPAVEAAS